MISRKNKYSPHGLGAMDLGLQWIYQNTETRRPGKYNKKHPDYKLKFGLVLLDLCTLVYTRTIQTKMGLETDLKIPDMESLQNEDPKVIWERISKVLQIDPENIVTTNYGKKIKIKLPTGLLVSSDFQLGKYLFFNGSMALSMRNRNNLKTIISPGMAMFQLRYERKFWEIGLPLVYQNFSKNISPGFHFRVFNFHFSTLNIIPYFNPAKASEFSLFFGIQISDFPGSAFKKHYPYMRFKKKACAEF